MNNNVGAISALIYCLKKSCDLISILDNNREKNVRRLDEILRQRKEKNSP
jgi:hypothetical protein